MPDPYRTKAAVPLSRLLPGQEFTIDRLDRKKENRKLISRLEQLGFQPGNKGICLYRNPGKGSLAFRINGSVIALRVEDASLIQAVCTDDKKTVCVMLTGNPNVGKSTVFNCLTGMHQHTGNWPGKTVELAEGIYRYGTGGSSRGNHNRSNGDHSRSYRIIDLPGTYSLQARSEEEAVTSEALKTRSADAVIVVCDASCLERSLRFALEVKALCDGDPDCCLDCCGYGCSGCGEADVCNEVDGCSEADSSNETDSFWEAKACGEAAVCDDTGAGSRTAVPVILCINLCDEAVRKGIQIDFALLEQLMGCRVVQTCAARGKGMEALKTAVAECTKECRDENGAECRRTSIQNKCSCGKQQEYSLRAADIIRQTVQIRDEGYWRRDYRIDRFLTAPVTGSICMLGMLFVLFWLTINGANYPSELLASLFGWFGGIMEQFLTELHCPELLADLWLDGVWKVSSWVISVMLPPMAIFFPLFTILEDLGYLPRAAFHLDGCFKKCHACGKQALTMCMGLGCNVVGVTGCRIIDTEKERLMAVLTNSLIPCNGRFPALIAVITMFFAEGSALAGGILMCAVILLAVFMTFLVTGLISCLLNQGKQSTFILELPPYRKPQFAQILVRSLIDRTLFVLSRAVMAAAPAGAVIWLLANIHVPASGMVSDPQTILSVITSALDTPAAWIGLDGAILFSFILGFPANEIVLPAVLMCYLARGSLVEVPDLGQLKLLLLDNGWTLETAVCMLIFTLFHWPCATTCMTIYKETGSRKWTAAAFLIPAVCGCILCGLIHAFFAGVTGS